MYSSFSASEFYLTDTKSRGKNQYIVTGNKLTPPPSHKTPPRRDVNAYAHQPSPILFG